MTDGEKTFSDLLHENLLLKRERDEARAENEKLLADTSRLEISQHQWEQKADQNGRERDEARAEVERLGRLLTDSTVIIRETVQILASVVRQVNGGKE